ncbi:XRE family transcriptional regulator [Halothiobacillus sp.]|uniref:helix-turn-helix domain-containing protein n=1 Tax=Halothiobacillus sp. TaxID=1891311 RepID=UPI00261EC9F7|nr:XRE family transcriptional regulator [Halothiobacillus sp.]
MSESSSEGSLERYLGNAIRDIRQKHGLTIADVANLAGISRGMLSKIENAQTATSLETLTRLSQALGVSLAKLFSGFDDRTGSAQLVKSGEGMEVVRRGTKKGHTYHLLAYDRGPRKVFEPFLITIDEESETFPSFEHPGVEFIYMLEGIVQYRHGKERYLLHPGDALTFDAKVPHGPDKMVQCPIRFLTVLMYPHADEE